MKKWLTCNEAAEALGVSPRTIRNWGSNGKLESKSVPGRGKGGQVFLYWVEAPTVPVEMLNDECKMQNDAGKDACGPSELEAHVPSSIDDSILNELSVFPEKKSKITLKHEREAIVKAEIVRRFLAGITPGSITKQRKDFVLNYKAGLYSWAEPRLKKISPRSLERWEHDLNDANGDYRALMPNYERSHGHNVPPDVQIRLLAYLKRDSEIPIMSAISQVEHEYRLAGKMIPVTSYTLYRFVKDWQDKNRPLWNLLRKGTKHFREKVLPTVQRDWSLIQPGDMWVSDGKEMNLDVMDENGNVFRPTLIGWFDAGSRMCVGLSINRTENADVIKLSFRNSCLFTGYIPKLVQIDNGKAYRSKIFIGSTRKGLEAPKLPEEQLEGIYHALGIVVSFSQPYNAKSKVIERFWLTMQNGFERFHKSWRGENNQAKPASMKRNEKFTASLNDRSPIPIEEFKMCLNAWMINIYGMTPHKGLDGRKPLEVLEAFKAPVSRLISSKQLNHLMLEKASVKISNEGVRVQKVDYWSPVLVDHVGKRALVRYDTWSIKSVLVYVDDQFVCQAEAKKLHHPHYKLSDTAELDRRQLADTLKLHRKLEKEAKKAAQKLSEATDLYVKRNPLEITTPEDIHLITDQNYIEEKAKPKQIPIPSPEHIPEKENKVNTLTLEPADVPPPKLTPESAGSILTEEQLKKIDLNGIGVKL